MSEETQKVESQEYVAVDDSVQHYGPPGAPRFVPGQLAIGVCGALFRAKGILGDSRTDPDACPMCRFENDRRRAS